MALVKTALPKSRSGRKATPLDTELLNDLVEALKDSPVESVDGENRPAAYGPDTSFDTEGKATSQGRRYANAVAESLDTTVRVNAYSQNGDKGPFFWRCYIPLSASQKDSKAENKQGNKK